MSHPAPDLGCLLSAQAQRAAVLRFHEFQNVRDVRLPLRRPSQHPVEDFLHLLFGHDANMASPPACGTPQSPRDSATRLD